MVGTKQEGAVFCQKQRSAQPTLMNCECQPLSPGRASEAPGVPCPPMHCLVLVGQQRGLGTPSGGSPAQAGRGPNPGPACPEDHVVPTMACGALGVRGPCHGTLGTSQWWGPTLPSPCHQTQVPVTLEVTPLPTSHEILSGPRNVDTESSVFPVGQKQNHCPAAWVTAAARGEAVSVHSRTPVCESPHVTPLWGMVLRPRPALAFHLAPPKSAAGLVPQVCPLHPQLTCTAPAHKVQSA